MFELDTDMSPPFGAGSKIWRLRDSYRDLIKVTQTYAQICISDIPQFEGFQVLFANWGLNKGFQGQKAHNFNPLWASDLLYDFGPNF